MKRFLIFILALFYLVISSGIAVNLHYCKGKLSAWEVGNTEELCASCGLEKTASDCCSNEMHLVKLELDQSVSDIPLPDLSPLVLHLLPALCEQFVPMVSVIRQNVFQNDSHCTHLKDIPIFIYHCLLLI